MTSTVCPEARTPANMVLIPYDVLTLIDIAGSVMQVLLYLLWIAVGVAAFALSRRH